MMRKKLILVCALFLLPLNLAYSGSPSAIQDLLTPQQRKLLVEIDEALLKLLRGSPARGIETLLQRLRESPPRDATDDPFVPKLPNMAPRLAQSRYKLWQTLQRTPLPTDPSTASKTALSLIFVSRLHDQARENNIGSRWALGEMRQHFYNRLATYGESRHDACSAYRDNLSKQQVVLECLPGSDNQIVRLVGDPDQVAVYWDTLTLTASATPPAAPTNASNEDTAANTTLQAEPATVLEERATPAEKQP